MAPSAETGAERPGYTVIARGLTTRPVQITGDEFMTAFSREALEGMARQVLDGYVAMPPEHLSYLGPVGRWVDAEVVELDDGHSELLMYGAEVDYYTPTGSDPAVLDELDALPEAGELSDVEVFCAVELRNFDASDTKEIEASAPLPLRHEHKWAELPPLEWIISIPVVWGAVKFAGAFFEELGRVSAKALASWLKNWSIRTKEDDRDWIVTLRFGLPNGEIVYGFVPVRSKAEDLEERIVKGLNSAGVVASVAGIHAENRLIGDATQVALILDDRDRWQLAWWTDGARVYRTKWFDDNCPDPERFLGRPLFETSRDDPSTDSDTATPT